MGFHLYRYLVLHYKAKHIHHFISCDVILQSINAVIKQGFIVTPSCNISWAMVSSDIIYALLNLRISMEQNISVHATTRLVHM